MLLPRSAKVLEFLLRVLRSGLRFAQLNADLHALRQETQARADAYERTRERARAIARSDAVVAAKLAAESARAAFGEEGEELPPDDEEEAAEAAAEAAQRARDRVDVNALADERAAEIEAELGDAGVRAQVDALNDDIRGVYATFLRDLKYVNAVAERLVAAQLAPYLADLLLVLDFNGYLER